MSALDGIRVLVVADRLTDFGGQMLSALGADVAILGTSDEQIDDFRRLAWRHGMRMADNKPVEDVLAQADILLDGRRCGAVLPELDGAHERHSRLVHVLAHGGVGAADTPVTDLTLMAASGLMHVIGDPDRPPLRLPGEQAYALTGIQVATAALMGLYARHRTGRGQKIDVSATQSAALANYREAVMYTWTGRIGRRSGNLLVRGASGVRQVWPCADGHVTWSMIDNPNMMRAVVSVIEDHGEAGELSDIKWNEILVADTDQAVIDRWQGIFAAFFARHTKAQLGGWSLTHGWGLSPIATLEEVRNSDHLAARGLFVDVHDDNGATLRLPGPLFATHRPDSAS